jgi:trk system potassium uptake protein TrkA
MIIGLGQFGMALGRALVGRGMEVLGIDTDEDRVNLGAMHLTEALCLDATEEAALGALAPAARDACVVAIGDHSRDASIICTALLTQFSARRIIARANTDVHARILGLVGAHEVVNPEQAFGELFANRVMFDQIKGVLPLNDTHIIAEFAVPGAAVGHDYGKVDAFRRASLSVLGLRRPGRVRIEPPRPDERLRDGDMLIVVAAHGEVERVLAAFGERGSEES